MKINIRIFALLLAASAAQADELPACRAGLHVPKVSPLNYPAVILAVDEAKGSYQVKSDADGLVDWVPASKLRYSCVGGAPKAVAQDYLYGNWSLFVGPTAHHEEIDGKGYLVVGSGAHVPPLLINADGTYVWTLDHKTTVSGAWRALRDDELRSGMAQPAILLLKAESGKDWMVWKAGVNAGNNRDAIGVWRTDLGLSYQGTRLP